jgi:hypothetical protein
MKQYSVKTKFTFVGTFIVNAKSKHEAKNNVERYCGLVIGGDIHTALSEEEIPDWKFDVHPDKVVLSVRRKHERIEKPYR